MLQPALPLMNSTLNEKTRPLYLDMIKKAKAGRVWIALGREALFSRGKGLETLEENLRYFEENGLEAGVWISSLGFGSPLSFEACSWTRIHSLEGKSQEMDAFCPEDPDFVLAFLTWVKDIAQKKPSLLMLDDELCLSVRPGIGCFCPRHLKLLREELGQDPDLSKIFTGGKNPQRDAYLKVMGNTLRDFCRKTREAVDQVCPQIRVGFCAGFTSWDLEGVSPIELSRILAGSTKPFFRLTGAPYWVTVKRQRFKGQRLSAVIENARNQIAWCKGEEIEIFAEADSYPRACYNTPAMLVENFDIAMHASGIPSLKYLFDYHSSPRYEKQYHKIHCRNLPLYEKLEGAFEGAIPCGVRVYRPKDRLENTVFPEAFVGEEAVMRSYFSKAAALLACQAIPVLYDGESDFAMVFGSDALYFEPKHKKVVLDLPAALLLQGKGIDTGIAKVIGTAPQPAWEAFADESVPFKYLGKEAEWKSLALKDGATVQSRYSTGQVASFTYKNFLVLNFDGTAVGEGSPILCSYERGRQLVSFFENPFPAIVGYTELYSICAKKENRHVVLFQNHSLDPVFDFEITLPKKARSFSLLGAEGTLAGDKILLHTEFSPQSTLLLEVEYEN